MTVLVFLEINGYELVVEDDMLFDVCIQIAKKQLDLNG